MASFSDILGEASFYPRRRPSRAAEKNRAPRRAPWRGKAGNDYGQVANADASVIAGDGLPSALWYWTTCPVAVSVT